MNYNSKNYSVQIIPLIEGTYFLGQVVFSNTNYYIGKDYIRDIDIESYEDSLTPEISNNILRIAKNLMTAFEYPVDSGNTFSISRSQFSYYNSMMLFKDNFTYPFEFLGNDGSSVVFQNSTDITTFVGAALVKHQDIYNNRYLIAVNAINQVVITTTLQDAITEVMNINY
jgi:hypothetical protein